MNAWNGIISQFMRPMPPDIARVQMEPDRPIVDINSTKTLERLGNAGDMLTLVAKEPGRITIERSE